MANFGGHAIPGSFFLLLGFWLTVKNILQHHWRTKHPKGRPITPPFFKKMNYFEGGLAMFASFVGACPSRLLSTLEPLRNLHSSHGGWPCCLLSGIMVEQFVPDGPHAHLYNNENNEWVKLMNWQHSTMYLFFGIYGIVLVASTATKLVPVGVNRLALSIALFVEGKGVEKLDLKKKKKKNLSHHKCVSLVIFCHVPPGFLFYYHVHMRPPLDSHIHSLLLVAVFGCSASIMLEVFIKDNIILELFGACMFILQGSWFYQVNVKCLNVAQLFWICAKHSASVCQKKKYLMEGYDCFRLFNPPKNKLDATKNHQPTFGNSVYLISFVWCQFFLFLFIEKSKLRI